MSVGGIDINRIQAMMEQLKAASTRAPSSVTPLANPLQSGNSTGAPKLDFADALKSSLDQVNGAQKLADGLGQRFSMGDESVNLSDVMISQQKASIAFQATVQVRNKLVSAYHDIMTMQV
jgi:flagellar hook-basal body complex protein FliE